MVSVDPVFAALVAALLVLFFFIFLLVRRTLLGFREGFDSGRR